MIFITKIENTCSACPSQWHAWSDNDQHFYIRYRHGVLQIWIDEEVVWAQVVGSDPYDGVMNFEELKKNLAHQMCFLCNEEYGEVR